MSTHVLTLSQRPETGALVAEIVLPTPAVGARDKEVWAVVPAAALSWHLIHLPAGLKKNSKRLLPALQALMEEHLLDEPGSMHLALAPGWQSSSQVWVAACNKAWLQQQLHSLQQQGREAHRIVPEWAPVASGTQQTQAWVSGSPEDAWLWVSDAQSAWRLPLPDGLTWWAQRLSHAADAPDFDLQALQNLTVQAAPAVAALAQNALQTWQAQWRQAATAPAKLALAECIGTWRIEATPTPERYARAAATQWDLAQFDLAAHGPARWRQNLLRAWQQFAHDRAWRPAKWGLALLVAAQLGGQGLAAWQLQDKVQTQQAVQKRILSQTFPHVTVVDPPLQMAKEVERLQRRAGLLSAPDLESMLQALGTSMPPGSEQTLNALDFQVQGAGELRLQGLQLTPPQESAWAQALQQKGYQVQAAAGQWRMTTAASAGMASAAHPASQGQQKLAQLEAQTQNLKALQVQTQALQKVPLLQSTDARAALQQRVPEWLGPDAQLSINNERATVTLKKVSAGSLAQFLSAARSHAQALPSEAHLQKSGSGPLAVWRDTLSLNVPMQAPTQ